MVQGQLFKAVAAIVQPEIKPQPEQGIIVECRLGRGKSEVGFSGVLEQLIQD